MIDLKELGRLFAEARDPIAAAEAVMPGVISEKPIRDDVLARGLAWVVRNGNDITRTRNGEKLESALAGLNLREMSIIIRFTEALEQADRGSPVRPA